MCGLGLDLQKRDARQYRSGRRKQDRERGGRGARWRERVEGKGGGKRWRRREREIEVAWRLALPVQQTVNAKHMTAKFTSSKSKHFPSYVATLLRR